MFGGLDDYSMDSAEQCGESRFCWSDRLSLTSRFAGRGHLRNDGLLAGS